MLRLMKESTFNSNKGFTFVEMVISIAIISILLIAGVIILAGAMTTISGEGTDTELLYQAQDVMEQLLAGDTPALDGTSPIEWSVINETMTLTGTSGNVNVPGKFYKVTERSTGRVLLSSFVPNSDTED
ncbi:MAG: prepilin-type N-terminal cleavage/methylation domain-containing protein [Eubacteriales bacterium]